MSNMISPEQLKTYKSLFKGREDVFAVRWEKDGRSGYMPAYDVDWNAYKIHKTNGGSFQNFKQKAPQPLSNSEILSHLEGKQFIGIYPMLQDNTSWFIVADFDEVNWLEDSKMFVRQCRDHDLPAYLERSRSGQGAHVWLFFDNPYPAIKSRRIVHALLKQIGINATSNKTSFDRLFPNQDFLSGKGFGNLIALPLHKTTWEKGNNCFIDTQSGLPIEQQWEFLMEINRISNEQLEKVHLMVSTDGSQTDKHTLSNHKLHICLDNKVHISRSYLPLPLINFLKQELNFVNSEFLIRKKIGRTTWGTQTSFKLLEETSNHISVPKGMVGKILRFCKQQNIELNFEDNRKKISSTSFTSTISLKRFQQVALDATRRKDIGIISAPPGSGKTIIGLSVIAEKQQPTLIIVHRKQLAEQWKDRIQSFLEIPKHEIGFIGQGEIRIGKKITIAMIQSLSSLTANAELNKLKGVFGLVIVDECHHIPAETYRECIEVFHSYYLYGLTATPFRRHNDEKLLFAYLGEIIAEVPYHAAHQKKEPTIIIRDTNFIVPFDAKTDKTETLLKILVHDSSRNRTILSDVEKEIRAGRKAIVITERKEHTLVLHQYLKQSFEAITLTGEDKEAQRNQKWKALNEGDFDVLITAGQLFGEGSDLHSIDCLFLVYPFSFEGKLVQYIGRVQRGEFAPIIYDYRDSGVEYLDKLFQQRNQYYNKLKRKGSLKENRELILAFRGDTVEVEGSNEIVELAALELPDSIQGFRENIRWLIRVIKFNEETGLLFCEVLNYAYNDVKGHPILLQFLDIKTIRFRSLDTDNLLKCATIKNRVSTTVKNPIRQMADQPIEIVEETIKIPIAMLEFGYGFIRFRYFLQQFFQQVEFEIANEDVRPEFEVLKPYFAKSLKSKKVAVGIRLEIQSGNLIARSATSFDLDRLNHDVIEGMKFSYVTKNVIGGKSVNEAKGILSLNQCTNPSESVVPLYQSEEKFLNDLLKWKNVKHSQQLKYLAKRHDVNVLKIRFVLSPFSFVFLLTGQQQYHIILETLDTEEATYIWHLNKNSDSFNEHMRVIDKAILELRSDGRQVYLHSNPENFSKIVHDYSNPQKGFISWKGLMETKIT